MGASASKIKFRESLTALTSRDVSSTDAEFWDELWKIPSSSEEVFELLTPSAARKLRDTQFENLATLFTQATAQLCQIVETPYTIYFDQALNCVRVLTRILPFLLERGDLGKSDPNVEMLCWGGGSGGGTSEEDESAVAGGKSERPRRKMSQTKKNKNSDETEDDEGVIDDEEEIGEEEVEKEGRRSSVDDDSEPLALLVVHAAMHMLFLPQFTCEFYEEERNSYYNNLSNSKSEDAHHHNLSGSDDDDDYDEEEDMGVDERRDKDALAEAGLAKPRKIRRGIGLMPRPAGIVWAPGVGFSSVGKCHVGVLPASASSAAALAASRNISYPPIQPVKFNPEAAYTRKYDKNRIEVLRLLLSACSDPLFSPADEYNPLASRWMAVAVAADAPNAPCLFYSLLNIFFGTPHHFSGSLCVLLDCGLSGSPVPYENRRGEPVASLNDADAVGFNIFRVLLARINNGKDLNTLYRGFVRILRNLFESKSTLLPNSQARLECHQELLILLWKTLDENPLFLDFILTRCDVCELVVPLCYLMYVSRRDGAQVGLIHICTFILLKLSGERSFGVGLNRPFRTKLPCDLPLFSGSHADLVTITLHKLIVNGSYRLVPLYSCFLTIVCNFSPYWRSMSLVTSVKLVNLFELFSSPKFLYSSEKAYKHIALLLEIFNNILQYQYHGNEHLVYALVRRKDSFGRLASLTLPKAIYQCDKAFPSSERPEYDADLEEQATQVTAMSMEAVDESGKPSNGNYDPNNWGDGHDLELATSVDGSVRQNVPIPPRTNSVLSGMISSSSASTASSPSAPSPSAYTPSVLPTGLNFSQSSHPIACLFHILFKGIAFALYMLGSKMMDELMVTVLCILLLAADFWVVKNITGRLLVGLRWWNKVDPVSGKTNWIFEMLSGSNVYGYYKCSADQRERWNEWINTGTQMGMSAMMNNSGMFGWVRNRLFGGVGRQRVPQQDPNVMSGTFA
ncbi:hypothetical protein ACHAWU_004758 [Discostella pseudostelligera]|uniref:Protein HID1 n=1 Tax=Discostella pseudostelligera TaxID=259834 RepID=A0ABD3MDM6_9STRA